MFAIRIDESGRVIQATMPEYATDDHIIVKDIPTGNIADYLYISGEFVHDPKPKVENKPLTIAERVAALEKAMPAPAAYVAGTYYYRGDKVTFAGAVYSCKAPDGVVCVWSPTEYPVYWEVLK